MKFSIKSAVVAFITIYCSITGIDGLQPATRTIGRTSAQASATAQRYLQSAATTGIASQNAPVWTTQATQAEKVTKIPGQIIPQSQSELEKQNELFKNLVVQQSYQKQQAHNKQLEEELKRTQETVKGYRNTAAYAGAAALIASLYGGIILYDANKSMFEKNDKQQAQQRLINKPVTLADKYSETLTDNASRIFVDDLVSVLDPLNNFSTEQQLQAANYIEKILITKPSLTLPIYYIHLGAYKTQLTQNSLTKKIKELNAQLKYQKEAESNYRQAIKKEPTKIANLSQAALKDEMLQGSAVRDLARYNLAKYYMNSSYFYQNDQDAEKLLKEIIGQPLITREFESPLKSEAIALLIQLQRKNK
jgi:hypothetical protein